MCGAILNRRRPAAAGDNLVAMPAAPAGEGKTERRAEDRLPAGGTAREQRQPSDNPAAREFPVTQSPPSPPRSTAVAEAPSLPGVGITPPPPAAAEQETPAAPSFSIFGVDTGAPPVSSRDTVEGLHGPSFLGLSDESNPDYLLEDEDGSGGARKWVFAIVVIVLAVLVVMQWRANSEVRAMGARAWSAVKARATGNNQVATGTQAPAEQTAQNAQQPPVNPSANSEQPAPAPSDTANPAGSGATANAPATPANAGNAGNPSNPSPQQNAAAPPPQNSDSAKQNETAQPDDQSAEPDQDASKARKPSDEERSAKKPARAARKPPAAAARPDAADEAIVTRAQGYLYGRGGPKSCSMALDLLKQAAGRGNSKASSQLGAMYATGNCAPCDRASAYRWFAKAADVEPGNSYLRENMNILWREMTPQERAKILQ